MESLRQYQKELRHEKWPDVEDLWNIPSKGEPTPKQEERVSDKICKAIKQYAEKYALTAGREVQLRRRTVPKKDGGEPGQQTEVVGRTS